MSGYLEIKYPFKANIGLNPFKSWRRQWCILRPSGTQSGGTLAVYCSEAGSAAGCIHLPSGCVVRRAKSRTRPFAFAVFPADDPRKPIVLLATQTLQDSLAWMDRIRALLNGDTLLDETNDSYSVTILPTLLSRHCSITDASASATLEGSVRVTATGLHLTAGLLRTVLVPWRHVAAVEKVTDGEKNKICLVTIDSKFSHGGGELKLLTPLADQMAAALKRAPHHKIDSKHGGRSNSDPDLSPRKRADSDDVKRSSWYSGPSDVSLDDIDLAMAKESKVIPVGTVCRWEAEGRLDPPPPPPVPALAAATALFDDSMCDRRSVASGIYEEIAEVDTMVSSVAARDTDGGYCSMARGTQPAPHAGPQPGPHAADPTSTLEGSESEPQYETVLEVYATVRRGRRPPPPPLPPRQTSKLGESWTSRLQSSPNDNISGQSHVTRHFSLGSLPRYCGADSADSAGSSVASSVGSVGSSGVDVGGPGSSSTLPTKARQKQPFSVFRKRLKSDSRLLRSPKSDILKENSKDVETKKKKFDFAPTRDIFKNFKVSKKMKNLKITTGLLAKGETKSCEFLDETEHVSPNRCSKSVECLDEDDFDGDLSIEFNDDAVADLALPQEIVDLILRSREQIDRIRLKENVECDYMGMSSVLPAMSSVLPVTGVENNTTDLGHYIVMSPSNRV